jgi:hypothetical protein
MPIVLVCCCMRISDVERQLSYPSP